MAHLCDYEGLFRPAGVNAPAACVRLTHPADSASPLLPVFYRTNLLPFAASGPTFGHLAALMALPWLAVTDTECAVLGRFFSRPSTWRNTADRAVRPNRS